MEKEIKKYRDKSKYDYSCSEAILHAANDYYNLNLSEESFHMMAPFSGGMFEKEVCGIVTGCVSVLGILFTKNVAHTSDTLREAVIEFKKEFKNNFQKLDCASLLDSYRDEIVGCDNMIIHGGSILKQIVEKYNK